MPRNTPRTIGVSPSEVMVNSGGDQFFLFATSDTPATVSISYGNLPDGTDFAGDAAFTGSPLAFTTSSTNYIYFRLATATLESSDSGFPSDPDAIPLWTIDVDGSGVVSNILDKRSWLAGAGGGGTGSVEERLKEILQHSVMEDMMFDALVTTDNVDGSSTGTFLGQSRYELAPGEVLLSNFTTAPPEHLALINQPYVAVLTDQLIDEVTDIQIDISRVVGGPPAYPSASDWATAPSNFSIVDLTGKNGTNGFNIRIENIGATTYEIVGWGIYSNPVTAPGGVIVPRTGIHVGGTGLDVYNTNPAAFKTSAANFSFSWDDSTDTLSWAAPSGTADDLVFEFSDDVLGTIERNLTSPSSLGSITAGDYVYFDVDRNDAPNTAITLNVNAGPPAMIRDRFILGKRVADPDAVADVFVLWNNHVLRSTNANSQHANLLAPPPLMSADIVNSLFAANAPTGANPVATIADLSGGGAITGFSAQTLPSGVPTAFGFAASTQFLILTSAIAPGSDGSAFTGAIVNTGGTLAVSGSADTSTNSSALLFNGAITLGAPGVGTQLGISYNGAAFTQVTATALSATGVTLQSNGTGTTNALVIGFA